jgi:hypothetical protein
MENDGNQMLHAASGWQDSDSCYVLRWEVSTDADWTVKFLGDWRSTERDGLVKIRINEILPHDGLHIFESGIKKQVQKNKNILYFYNNTVVQLEYLESIGSSETSSCLRNPAPMELQRHSPKAVPLANRVVCLEDKKATRWCIND